MKVRQAVRKSLGLLNSGDQRKLAIATAVQVATSLLDLAGVLLISAIGVLAVTLMQEQPPPSALDTLLTSLGLVDLPGGQILGILALLAAVLLVGKSAISTLVMRRIFRFLAGRQAALSATLSLELFSRPLPFLQRWSSQQIAYAITTGAAAATLGILGQCVIAIAEISLLLVLGATLVIVDPVIAVGSIIFFLLVAATLQYALGSWATRSGKAMVNSEIDGLDAIQEVVAAYREVSISGRRSHYIDRIGRLRWQAARAGADVQFIGSLPKYVFEVALVLGGLALASYLFATQTPSDAVGTMVLFLAAGTRVMPSIARLQGSFLSLRNAAGIAEPTYKLWDALQSSMTTSELQAPLLPTDPHPATSATRFSPTIELRDVTFTYDHAARPAVREACLSVPAGTSLALVGLSGAGKSTMADLILGVLKPDSGQVSVGGTTPREAIREFPGLIAYVPQDTVMANASIRANVALGLPPSEIDDSLVWEALERAHLADLLRQERAGLDTLVGERGVRLSGGQRQRLGIARALYTRPALLVLDEATSSLDAETEIAITDTIEELGGDVTTVVIAHRLSTVRRADQVAYLDEGRIRCVGTFSEVRRIIPAFDQQARIMGLR